MLLLMDVLSVSTKNTALSNKVKQAGYPISCLFFFTYLTYFKNVLMSLAWTKHFLYAYNQKGEAVHVRNEAFGLGRSDLWQHVFW